MVQTDTAEQRRLAHRRDELVRRHELTAERVALFPNAVNQRQLDELAAQIDAIDIQIRALAGDEPVLRAVGYQP